MEKESFSQNSKHLNGLINLSKNVNAEKENEIMLAFEMRAKFQ